MANFHQIKASIWEDEKFEALQLTDSKLLFFYLCTNHRCPVSGIYKISIKIIEFETGIDDVIEHLSHLVKAKLVDYDFDRNVVWVRGKIKHDRSWKSEMRKKSIKRDFSEFWQASFMRSVTEKYPELIDIAIQAENERNELLGAREVEAESPLETEEEEESNGSVEGIHRVDRGSHSHEGNQL